MKFYNIIYIIIAALLVTSYGCNRTTKTEYRYITKEETNSGLTYTESISVKEKYILLDESSKTTNINAILYDENNIVQNNKVNNNYNYRVQNKRSSELLEYRSSNPEIISVDSNGNVTGVSHGFAVITITSKSGKADKKKILINYINKNEIDEVNSPSKIALDSGTVVEIFKDTKPSDYLFARPLPIGVKKDTLKYVILDEDIVSMDKNHKITGKNNGKTDIVIYSESNPKVYSVVKVLVFNSKPVSSEDSNIYDIPEGLGKLDMSGPIEALSLVGSYWIINYNIDNGKDIKPARLSELRVGASTEKLDKGVIVIPIYIKMDDKEVSLNVERPLGDTLDVAAIFKSLGAKITGDYTLQFTMDPVEYSRVADFRMVPKGSTLKLNLQKYASLDLNGGLGDNINFDPNAAPPAIKYTPIDVKSNPTSLIGIYKIDGYSNDGEAEITPKKESEFRVNANIDKISSGVVTIQMYLKLEDKVLTFDLDKTLDSSAKDPIGAIFDSLGAEVIDDKSLNFKLSPNEYKELKNNGFMVDNKALNIKLTKIEDLPLLDGLGSGLLPNNTKPSGPSEPETPEIEDKPVQLQVESIRFREPHYMPKKINEQIELIPIITPASLNGEKLVWKSSDTNIADVTQDGVVTIKNAGTKEVTVTATATNGVVGTFTIVVPIVTDFYFETSKVTLIKGFEDTYNISYKVEPEILQSKVDEGLIFNDFKLSPDSKKDVIEVDSYGSKMIKVLKNPGIVTINTTVQNITKDLLVEVKNVPDKIVDVKSISLEKAEVKHSINDPYFDIKVNFTPKDATIRVLEFSGCKEYVSISRTGRVKHNGKTGSCTILVKSKQNLNATAELQLVLDKFASDIKFDKKHYGLKVGETLDLKPHLYGEPTNRTITYSSNNPNITVDPNSGLVTVNELGEATITASTENGLERTVLVSGYTPVDINNKSTLTGTYEIVDFEQWNGKLDVSTTDTYGRNVERMIGEITIQVDGNDQVTMNNKIQMDSTKMDTFPGVMGFGVTEARQGQFNRFTYNQYRYSPNKFGQKGGKTHGEVTGSGENQLLITQVWQEGAMGINVDVNVKTWIRKKSNKVYSINTSEAYWHKGGENYNRTANAFKHHKSITPPKIEPYFKEGLTSK